MKFRKISDTNLILMNYLTSRPHETSTSINFLSKYFSQPLLDRIVEHFDTIEKVFPGNWDFQITSVKAVNKFSKLEPLENNHLYHQAFHEFKATGFKFIIRIPETDVVNENGNSTTIYDLFMSLRYEIKEDFISLINFLEFTGLRTTMTYDQWVAGYMHSHLRAINNTLFPYFRTFCLNSSSLQKSLNYCSSLINSYNQTNFQMLLLQAKQLASMESEEGGPHIRMSRININGLSSIATLYDRTCKSVYDNAFNRIIAKDWSNLNMIVEDGNILILNKNVIEANIKTIIPQAYLVYKASNGEYYRSNSIDSSSYIRKADRLNKQNKHILNFRGKKFFYKINPANNNVDTTTLVSVPNPSITDYVLKRLQARATRNYHIAQITSEKITNETASSNDRPRLQAGNVFMSLNS